MTILGILWLAIYNLGINWEIEEVKIIRCSPLYIKNLTVKEDIKKRKQRMKKVRTIEKLDRDEWKFIIDREKVKEMVPR